VPLRVRDQLAPLLNGARLDDRASIVAMFEVGADRAYACSAHPIPLRSMRSALLAPCCAWDGKHCVLYSRGTHGVLTEYCNSPTMLRMGWLGIPVPGLRRSAPSLSDKPLRAHPPARPPTPAARRAHAACALRMTMSVRSPRCAMPTPSRGRRSSAHYSRPDGTGARVRRHGLARRATSGSPWLAHRLAAALAKRSSAVPTRRKALRCRQLLRVSGSGDGACECV
jgi:hypothetical protein